MTERDWRRSLRGAVYRGDGVAVVASVRTGGIRDDALQLLGDGLLVAIIGRVEHAVELGAECVNALRARGWYGDDDLAEQLDAALGRGAIPIRRSLPIDLDELATILEGDPVNGGGRIDLRTGEVWHRAAIEYAREMGEENEEEPDDPDRWLWVDCEAPATHTATWSGSSARSPIATAPTGSRSPSRTRAPSGGSRTSSPGGPTSSNAGTPCLRSASAAGHAPGSPPPATAQHRQATPDPSREALAGRHPTRSALSRRPYLSSRYTTGADGLDGSPERVPSDTFIRAPARRTSPRVAVRPWKFDQHFPWSGRRDSNPRPSPWQGRRGRLSREADDVDLRARPWSCPLAPPNPLRRRALYLRMWLH